MSTAGHTRRRGEDGYVTVIIDLTPTHEHSGPARLLDLVAGRSAAALTSWLAAQPASFDQAVEVVAMDGFGGYKTAAAEAMPDAITVMDPFHVVALAGAKSICAANASSSRPSVTAATPATRSTGCAVSCGPGSRCSAAANKPD